MAIEVRPAAPDDVPAVAALRWRWVTEGRADAPVASERDAFVAGFTAWARDHAATHTCSVVADGDRLLGMAWLAEVPRPPSPGREDRRSGDLQSVYVVPELRGRGWGGRLTAAVLAGAAALGLEHVTVHSSAAATSLYLRAGFTDDPRLLMTDL
jgi:ribosomal protein S18 acetylase RimI-like enzyme